MQLKSAKFQSPFRASETLSGKALRRLHKFIIFVSILDSMTDIRSRVRKTAATFFAVMAVSCFSMQEAFSHSVKEAVRLNPTAAELVLSDGHRMTVDFYAPDIFRLFRDDNGGIVRNPEAEPAADILVQNPRRGVTYTIEEGEEAWILATGVIRVAFAKEDGTMTVTDLRSGREVLRQTAPVRFEVKGGKPRTTIVLAERAGEYFYGGGVQNGRFSHKGHRINIVNENSWTDGGVASPAPYYWSTAGYGIMWHTFAPGEYDFGAETAGTVRLTHDTDYLDMFVMAAGDPVALLDTYYQLTGHPVLLPKFAFYEGHLNAYNRDWWVEADGPRTVPFEDGRRYKESQKDNGGIRESLNGEKDNYQFSARAVVDRYEAHDMPLGWILPNDGYGAGYGQTSTLDSNILNLKSFGDYARSKGVEIGLWTQSDLHPKEGVEALLQRDIVKEVRDAGVRVLKTDVAWVGWGYSFGLNGIADVAGIMPYYGNDARPFIITLDGWAGTQRYAGVWSGDQTGGDWEYIRFHIPTYIGSGLSGQPNICSDMDGIFGGLDPVINIRDFQWKAFSIMQLNMDGWGSNEKYPHALGEPAASINRMYLKLKSELLPYAYTWSRAAVDGKPLMRAMFLDYPDDYTYTSATRYQYLFGPDFLVAPVYQDTQADTLGNDIRDGIFLPEGRWVDYFTGDLYEGGRILENFPAPLWKLPVFVRQGAVIPMARPSNNPSQVDPSERILECWPAEGEYHTHLYDDDGRTMGYLSGESVTTRIDASLSKGRYVLVIHPAEGAFNGFVKDQSTEVRINLTARPGKVTVKIGGKKADAACSYEEAPQINRFATPGSAFEKMDIRKNPVLTVSVPSCDITRNDVVITVEGCEYAPADGSRIYGGPLSVPVIASDKCMAEPYSVTLAWEPQEYADYYEIETGGMLHTGIRNSYLTFQDLKPETEYSFRLRAVNRAGVSDWTEYTCTTGSNPLEWAVRGIVGSCSFPSQEGFEVWRLFDWAESGDTWHTRYQAKALPFELTLDLQGISNIDRFEYLPRQDAGNGVLLKGEVFYSVNGKDWTSAGPFEWERDGSTKVFAFPDGPRARYIRIAVSDAVNNYGSGREIYVFRVPGTETVIPGDINKDGKVDGNDLTSYMNYTGLRRGDSDFDYVSDGDIDGNGLIDAYDISAVAVRLEGGIDTEYWMREFHRTAGDTLSGTLRMEVESDGAKAGDTLAVSIFGDSLKAVNALSLAIPYDPAAVEYIGTEAPGLPQMDNLTRDRLHTDGTRAVYPTFVNLGDRPLVSGDTLLLQVRFRILKDGAVAPRPCDAVAVSPALEYKYMTIE